MNNLCISFAYDEKSRRTKATSYDAASGGNVVNQVKLNYADSNGDWGQITKLQQDSSGAVTGASPAMDYAYDDGAVSGAAKYVRLSNVTCPDPSTNRQQVYYNYASSGVGAKVGQINNIANDANGSTKYASYSYLGASTIYKATHPQVTGGLVLNYDTNNNHQYSGWDRFGRVTDQSWTNIAASTTFDQYKYAYDKSGNRTYRQNTTTSGKDEFYTYDGLNRLDNMQRGTLNATKTGITGTPSIELGKEKGSGKRKRVGSNL